MKSIGSIFVACGLTLAACGTAGTQTPAAPAAPALRSECMIPHEGGMGICNAYCNAKRCHEREDPECPMLRQDFLEKTGSPIFPCDDGAPASQAVNPNAKADPGGDGSVAKPG